VNGDGKADLVGFGYNGVVARLSNGSSFTGGGTWNTEMVYNQGWNANTVRCVADASGDGKADLIGFGLNQVVVRPSNGSSFTGGGIWLDHNFVFNSNEWF
jgi:hypothetical protein